MNELLSKLITDDDFERMRLELNAPNIFSALAVQRKEIRHSNFIGYLLDPNETHQLNDLVLRTPYFRPFCGSFLKTKIHLKMLKA